MFEKVEKDTNLADDSKKMKFLDDLFDSKSEYLSTGSAVDRTYVRLIDSEDYSRQYSNESKMEDEKKENSKNSTSLYEINRIFGLKSWIGLILSFFFLCYVFSFKMIIIIPLLCLVFIIYSVMSYGNIFYYNYLKKIRVFVKSTIRKIKQKFEEESYNSDYKLMEI